MPEKHGVQLMKEIKNLKDVLKLAKENEMFGTKARSVIKHANAEGIRVRNESAFSRHNYPYHAPIFMYHSDFPTFVHFNASPT